MLIYAHATVRLTLISLLENVQFGMGLNVYTFLCFLQLTVVFMLHNYLNGKFPKFKASLGDSETLLP